LQTHAAQRSRFHYLHLYRRADPPLFRSSVCTALHVSLFERRPLSSNLIGAVAAHKQHG
jgi:hypothetical protein